MNDKPKTQEKPYKLILFPKTDPKLEKPQGQHKYKSDKFHGRLSLTLTVETALHVSTGVVMLGSDIGKEKTSLIKTMITGTDEHLIIPGSSLKGAIRSVYEAITNSTLGVVTPKYKDREYYPEKHCPPKKERDKNKIKLCPARRIFGSINWQGLAQFSDAKCENVEFDVGFIRSLEMPQPHKYLDKDKVKGRKFYYHATRPAAATSQQRGLQVQRAIETDKFSTEVRFMNLSKPELGAFFIALGLDSKYPFALKVGAGKPVGMGTMTVEIKRVELWQNTKNRYDKYWIEPDFMTGAEFQPKLDELTKIARESELIELDQLTQLAEILKWPTDREPVEGNY